MDGPMPENQHQKSTMKSLPASEKVEELLVIRAEVVYGPAVEKHDQENQDSPLHRNTRQDALVGPEDSGYLSLQHGRLSERRVNEPHPIPKLPLAMGHHHVDVFCALLSHNLGVILDRILALLDDPDLIRYSGLIWVLLSCIQNLLFPYASLMSGWCSLPVELDWSLNQTRFNSFVQAASSLQPHESLLCCRRCNSPACRQSEALWATCMHADCRFVFCTLCRRAFHGALPCRTLRSLAVQTVGNGKKYSRRAPHRL